ncbi:MAG: HEAT repeat domain-containing protein [Blastocatellia bacterium]|nr:HEAT repeat domain-containing protein [Blastocatellia bacterium]
MKLFLVLTLSLATVAGAKFNLEGEMLAEMSGKHSTANATGGQVQGFTKVDGTDLKSRLDEAVRQGRSEGKRFWTAYTFDVRPGVGIDVVIIGSRGSIITINGVTNISGGRYETRNLGVFLLHEKGGGSIVRAELYNLERERDYSGYAVYWLGRGHNEESLNLLAGLVKTVQSVEAADRLTDCIGVHDAPQVEGILKDLIRNSSIERVRATAVSWLGHIPGQTPFLAGLVRDERESLKIRKEAADAIGESPDGDALATLQQLYASVRHREVRREILDSVSDNDDKSEAVNFLVRVAESEPDRELRREAIESLGEQQDARTLQALERIVNDSSAGTELQRAAVEAIGERPEGEAVPLLKKVVKTHASTAVRREAIERLGDLAGQMSFLIDLARDERESLDLRREAISALAESDDAAAVSALQSLYSSVADRKVKQEIISAVEDSEDTSAAITFLTDITRNDADPEARERAISVLGEIDEDRAAEALSQLYDSERSEEVRERILSALGESDSRAALKKLMDVARNDPSMRLRKRAISAISESDDPEAVRFLEGIIR